MSSSIAPKMSSCEPLAPTTLDPTFPRVSFKPIHLETSLLGIQIGLSEPKREAQSLSKTLLNKFFSDLLRSTFDIERPCTLTLVRTCSCHSIFFPIIIIIFFFFLSFKQKFANIKTKGCTKLFFSSLLFLFGPLFSLLYHSEPSRGHKTRHSGSFHEKARKFSSTTCVCLFHRAYVWVDFGDQIIILL